VGNLVQDPRLLKRAASPSFRARTVRNALERARQRRPEDDGGASRHEALFPLLRRLAIVLLPGAVLLFWMWTLGAQRRTLDAMPPHERAALYAESLAAFETACALPHAGLVEHCHDQAAFLASFEECGTRCRELVSPLLRWRSR
jgi:hypothetical protein